MRSIQFWSHLLQELLADLFAIRELSVEVGGQQRVTSRRPLHNINAVEDATHLKKGREFGGSLEGTAQENGGKIAQENVGR